jgi:cytochrome c oxidase cbb3-type subunit III
MTDFKLTMNKRNLLPLEFGRWPSNSSDRFSVGKGCRQRATRAVLMAVVPLIFMALAPVCSAAAKTASAKPRDGAAPSSDASQTAAIDHGREQFISNCAFCHGPDATGGRGPDLVRSKLVADDKNGNLIGEVVRNGRPAEGMPAFTMTSGQIADIAAFLHSQVQAAVESRTMGGGAYPVSRLLTGSPVRGKAYFAGAGGCTACHSPTGDLAHIASKYEPLDLELRMLYPPGVHATVTVHLASGEQVKGTLLHLDEFNVALRDAAGWYHSYSRKQVQVSVHDPLAAHQALLNKLTQDQFHDLFAYLESLK